VAVTKAKKEEILAKLKSIKDSAESIVFVGFKGLTVSDTSAMRRKMREDGVGYLVAKKTLMNRVFGEGYKGDMPALDGEVAIAWSDDAILPAQNVRAFEKKFADQISILGGVFEGAWKDKAEMTEIASIPSREILLGMFVNVINSPIQGLVVGLNALAEKKEA
jgi:large subunit ribosomal protein L10